MKMPPQLEEPMLAPCGMNCAVCYVHLREKKPCSGCLGDNVNKPDRCKRCKILLCARERGHTRCFECADFPCKFIKNMERSYKKRYQVSLIACGEVAQDRGVAAFLAEDRLRWTCEACGGAVSLHDKRCSECGATP